MNILTALFVLLAYSSVLAVNFGRDWIEGDCNYSVTNIPDEYKTYAEGQFVFTKDHEKINGKMLSNNTATGLDSIKACAGSLFFDLAAGNNTYFYKIKKTDNKMTGKLSSQSYEYDIVCTRHSE